MLLDLVLRDRRGQQDAPARGGTGEFADGDVGRARQRGRLLDRRAAAVGEHKAAIAAIFCDAIGEGKGEHQPGGEIARAFRLLH